MFDLRLINGSCYIDGEFKKVNIYIEKGKIAKITDAVLPASDSYDCTDKMVLPGLIDPHVHFDLDLGEFKSVDDFYSGSKAAIYGGITTIIDFLDPIFENSDYEEALKNRLEKARECNVDYGFHCTLGNYLDDTDHLFEMIKKDGISSIKVFTAYSESNRKCSYNIIEKLLKSKNTILSHSEYDSQVISEYSDVATYELSRNEISEMTAIKKLIGIKNRTGGKLYIVHTSSGNTLEMIEDMTKPENLFLESCPHYFYLTNEKFADEDGRLYLLAPPLRSSESLFKLRHRIDYLDTIATDHCPFMIEEKLRYKDASKVPKGIGSIEYSFLLMYELFGEKIIDKFTKNPKIIFNLKDKGEIKENLDGDFCIIDPDDKTYIKSGHSNSDYSVYEGIIVDKKIISTVIRGEFVLRDGEFLGGRGKYIRRDL